MQAAVAQDPPLMAPGTRETPTLSAARRAFRKVPVEIETRAHAHLRSPN